MESQKYSLKELLYIGVTILTGNDSKLAKENIALKKKAKSLDSELKKLREDGDKLESESKRLRGEEFKITLNSLERERKYYGLMRVKLYQIICNLYKKNPTLNN